MSPDVLTWLSKTGGAAAVLILALWLFRDEIYFSFGRPPAGVQFRHPADKTSGDQDDAPRAIAPRKRRDRQRSTRQAP